MVYISDATIQSLDFSSALQKEISWEPDLIPKQIVDEVMSGENLETWASYLKNLTLASPALTTSDLITANKWRHGRRTIHAMPIRERVFYRAIVDYLAPDLPAYTRSNEDFERFENGPLEAKGATHVIKTDIANYFSSIDHDLIISEIIDRTGRREIAEFLGSFWRSVSGRPNGIPQMSEPSKLISELLVERMERNLVRRGYLVWRYADDFRIATHSAQENSTAMDALYEESRALGLSISERKTFVLSTQRYAEVLAHVEEAERAANDSAFESLRSWNRYADDYQYEHDEATLLRQTALEVLTQWSSTDSDEMDSGLLERHKLVRNSLNVLTALSDPDALSFIDIILEREPQLTPTIARYLRATSESNADLTLFHVSHVLTNVPVNRWQRLWIAWTLQTPSIDLNPTKEAAKNCLRFCRDLLDDGSELVRSHALWTLATHKHLTYSEWASADVSSTPLSSPYVAAALNRVDMTTSIRRQLSPLNKLDARMASWGENVPY